MGAATGTAGRSAEAEARRRAVAARAVPPELLAGLTAAVLLLAGAVVGQAVEGATPWFVLLAVVAGTAVWLVTRRPLDIAPAVVAGVWAVASPAVGALLAPSPFPVANLPAADELTAASLAAAGVAFLLARRHGMQRAAWSVLAAWVGFVGAALAFGWMAPRLQAPAGLIAVGVVLAARGGGWRAVSALAGRWQRGAAGERLTASLLSRLDAGQFRVLHDLALPASQANVDHLVIGPTGVFVIDTKVWSGTVVERAGGYWYAGRPLTDWLAAAAFEADQVAAALDRPVTLVVCVHGASLPAAVLRVPLASRDAFVAVPQLLVSGLVTSPDVLGWWQVHRLAVRARRTLRSRSLLRSA
jgi:Nuclease-related domain